MDAQYSHHEFGFKIGVKKMNNFEFLSESSEFASASSYNEPSYTASLRYSYYISRYFSLYGGYGLTETRDFLELKVTSVRPINPVTTTIGHSIFHSISHWEIGGSFSKNISGRFITTIESGLQFIKISKGGGSGSSRAFNQNTNEIFSSTSHQYSKNA
jgi:hypothetical protein